MLPRCTWGVVALLLMGCESTLPNSPSMSAPDAAAVFTRTPERDYRIPDAVRTKLPPTIDSEALQTLLARVRPEYRARILESFQEIPTEAAGRSVSFGPVIANTGDPEIDALFRRVRRAPPSADPGTGSQQ